MLGSKNKIKVLLLYIVYPLAMGTYFKKALEHREDVDLKVTGQYTANWMPWLNGMTVPMKYAIPPHIPLDVSPNVREVNYEMVQARLGDWKPDIIINVDANLHWRYKPTGGYVVTVGTDPHVLNDFYDVPRKYSDKFYNMQLCYSKENDIYLSYAYSTYDHYPLDGSMYEQKSWEKDGMWRGITGLVEKDTDAVLVGMPYENRVRWVDELRKCGVSVIFENGPIFDEARTLYNRGRIGLNWSSMLDTNARVFELAAMKLAPVINRTPDINQFLSDGLSYLGFDDLRGAVEEVLYLKNHPKELSLISENAYKAIQGQTYDARVEKILKECGFV